MSGDRRKTFVIWQKEKNFLLHFHLHKTFSQKEKKILSLCFSPKIADYSTRRHTVFWSKLYVHIYSPEYSHPQTMIFKHFSN